MGSSLPQRWLCGQLLFCLLEGSFGNRGSLFMEMIGSGNGPGVKNNDKTAFCLLPWNV